MRTREGATLFSRVGSLSIVRVSSFCRFNFVGQ